MTKQVLVVEDEPNIAMALEFLMKQQGYAVRSEADGDSAMGEVERDPPDLVLLDINIPGRSGFEVCEAIRANPAWNTTRILILTGKGRDVDRTKGIRLGADDYVTKPFATKDVIAKVKALLSE
jgi:DNA-binding response OmpR family regulator